MLSSLLYIVIRAMDPNPAGFVESGSGFQYKIVFGFGFDFQHMVGSGSGFQYKVGSVSSIKRKDRIRIRSELHQKSNFNIDQRSFNKYILMPFIPN